MTVDVSEALYQAGPGGYYKVSDRSGPYAIDSSGVATLLSDLSAATGSAGAGTPAAATRTVAALAATGTQTSVASSASDGTILAANVSRVGFSIFNDSTATLYLLLASGTSSSSNYTVQVGPGAFFENAAYAGVVKGIWSAANGNARVTEYT